MKEDKTKHLSDTQSKPEFPKLQLGLSGRWKPELGVFRFIPPYPQSQLQNKARETEDALWEGKELRRNRV